MNAERLVHLHVHSDHSNLDGLGRIDDYAKRAAERGHPAICATDHGTLRNIHDLAKAGKKYGLKPIYGAEFYVATDMRRKGLTPEERAALLAGVPKGEHGRVLREHESREGLRDRWHLTVWAVNNAGLANLFRLATASYLEGFYYKPRIDLDELCKHNEGLAVGLGCLSGAVLDPYLRGQKRAADERAEQLHAAFGDRFWLEVMAHGLGPQAEANRYALELRRRYPECRLLGTQDAHYCDAHDWRAHDVLLCIGTAAKLTDATRFRFDGQHYWFRTRDQMAAAFDAQGVLSPAQVGEALDSTMEFAERCTAEVVLDPLRAFLPEPVVPAGYADAFAHLVALCKEGWAWRDIPERARRIARDRKTTPESLLAGYARRLKMELATLRDNGFTPYFLLVREVCNWARSAKIAIGPGRGSAAGSLVAYLVGITAIDPIEWDLMFERFIAPGRVDLPDVDLDFEDARRGEIIEWLRQRFGAEHVAQIATVGRFSVKQALRDVCRVLDVPYARAEQASKAIPERPGIKASEVFGEIAALRSFDEQYPDVRRYVEALESTAKVLGVHAAGVVVAPRPVSELCPLEVRKGVVVTALDMRGVADLGLVKMDVLGLRTMTVIRLALDLIEKRTGERPDLERLVPDDQKVLQGFTDQDFEGVFQFDAASAYAVCAGVQFRRFMDVATMTAVNRPGATRSGLAAVFVDRLNHPEKRAEAKASTPALVWEATADTFGVMVYQEQIIRLARTVAGYDPVDADKLRKLIGKKLVDEIAKERGRFAQAAQDVGGLTEEEARRLFDNIESAGSYVFNRSHAVAYATIAYWCMWLKRYYSSEWWCALLSTEPKREAVQRLASAAWKAGVEILPADVMRSEVGFTLEPDGRIRASLEDLKSVGPKAVEAILAARPFATLAQFLARVDRRACNRRTFETLIRGGTFRSLIPNTRWALEHVETLWESKGAPGKVEFLQQQSEKAERWSAEEELLHASDVNPLAFGRHPVDAFGPWMAEHLGVKLAEGDIFEAPGGHWVAGVCTARKLRQVGDHHVGEMPSREEQLRKGWGQPYATATLDTPAGAVRLRIDTGTLDIFREAVDGGVGAPLLVLAVVRAGRDVADARVLIDLRKLAAKPEAERTLWERIATGQHPAKSYPWRDEQDERRARVDLAKAAAAAKHRFAGTGVVTHTRERWDRRGRRMAWFGVLGLRGFVEAVSFGSSWGEFRDLVRPGEMCTFRFEKSRDGAVVLDAEGGWVMPRTKWKEQGWQA